MGKEIISTIDKINNKIIIGNTNNHIFVYNIDNKKKIAECYEENELIKNSKIIDIINITLNIQNENKQTAVVAYSNGIVQLWEYIRESKIKEYNVNDTIYCIKYHENKLLIGGNSENLKVINIETDEERVVKVNK